MAYYPIERDEQPVEIPKPPPKPKPIVIVKPKPVPAPVVVKKKEIPVKEYPYCGPGISVRLEPIIKNAKPIV